MFLEMIRIVFFLENTQTLKDATLLAKRVPQSEAFLAHVYAITIIAPPSKRMAKME